MNPRARRLSSAITIAGILSAFTGEPMKAQPQVPPQQPPPIVPAPLIPDVKPVRTCESLVSLVLPDTTIESAAVDQGNGTIPASCRVTAIATHPPAGDRITIWIALPVAGWNGRFQGVGGGGFSGGSANALAQPLRAGYAAGSTDTGHAGTAGSFALDGNGRL